MWLLLTSTVVYIFGLPFMEQLPTLVRLSEIIMLFVAVAVCARSRRHLWIALGLGVPAVVLSWVSTRETFDFRSGAGTLFEAALLLWVFVLMMRHLLLTGSATLATILLAMNAYLMMALAWAIIFVAVELALPGSFNCCVDGARTPGWHADLLYFSFVTLTTLGYGDVLPLGSLAKSLASLEAVAGTLFLAVVIAGLLNRRSVAVD